MQQLTDVQAAMAALTTAVNSLIGAYNTNAVNPADVEALATEATALTASINAVLNPAPAP